MEVGILNTVNRFYVDKAIAKNKTCTFVAHRVFCMKLPASDEWMPFCCTEISQKKYNITSIQTIWQRWISPADCGADLQNLVM